MLSCNPSAKPTQGQWNNIHRGERADWTHGKSEHFATTHGGGNGVLTGGAAQPAAYCMWEGLKTLQVSTMVGGQQHLHLIKAECLSQNTMC